MAVSHDIETAIEAHLKSAGMALLEIGRTPDTIRAPAIAVAVIGGSMKGREGRLDQTLRVVVTIGAANIREDGERLRRKLLHELVENVVALVSMQTFDLEIQPLAPGDWRETTNADDLRVGLIMGEVEFATKSQTKLPTEDDAAVAISEIVSSFHLGDGRGGTEAAPRIESMDILEEDA